MTDFGSGKGRKSGVKTPPIAWVVAGAMVLALAGGGWAFIKVNEHNGEQQLIAQREMVRTFGEVLDDEAGKVIDTTPKADGAAGAIERAAKILCRQIVEDDRAMDREITALHFDKDTLDSTSEVDLDGIAVIAQEVAKARKVVARYRDLRHSRVAAFRAAVSKAHMSLTDKETMLKRFNRALDSSFYDNERLWRVRDEVLRANGELVEILLESRGQWQRTSYGAAFTNAATFRRFDQTRWKLNQARWELREVNSKGVLNARRQLEAAARNLEP
ncbi:MAG: hypothetical protein K1X35_11425 [Caulobacteraceae bacterium]|nr:hypothetical protein [Caulobacteraceae bacterium]